jgi:hypothetical protein
MGPFMVGEVFNWHKSWMEREVSDTEVSIQEGGQNLCVCGF